MTYEVVNLQEKTVVGLCKETSNSDPNMGTIIGGLWQELYQGGVGETIKHKSNAYAIGLYSDYHDDKYDVTVGNEVSESENPELTTKTIPAGKYAKFIIKGHMQMAVAEAWGKIWSMDLDRSFSGDFEEYMNADFENAIIHIYIALK